MTSQDEPWIRCPLKQEIRAGLWESYVKTLTGTSPLRSYLTLYSPPIMDVKHLANRGLITFDGEVYRGVVGVAYTDEGYAEAVKQGRGRLEKLFTGDIRDILTNRNNVDHKSLSRKFPFDAVNLDYTEPIFCAANTHPISFHLKALDALFRLQKRTGCERFCLFLTTRAETGQLAESFLSEFKQRINDNLLRNTAFGQAFYSTYQVGSGDDLKASSHDDFVTLGLIKFVVSMLKDFQYEVKECDAVWLVRDASGPHVRSLLHLAFLIELHTPTPALKLQQYGRRLGQYHFGSLIAYMKKRASRELAVLKESIQGVALEAKHRAYIDRLVDQTYELPIPQQQQ